jgi:hypothetical protein
MNGTCHDRCEGCPSRVELAGHPRIIFRKYAGRGVIEISAIPIKSKDTYR